MRVEVSGKDCYSVIQRQKKGTEPVTEFQHALTVWYLTRSEPAHIFHQLLFGILFG